MRRGATVAALAAMAALLGGCVYDPYTGTYVPCCNYYGYPNGYGYAPPPPYGAYGYAPRPYGSPPPAQPGPYGGQPPYGAQYDAPGPGPYGAPPPLAQPAPYGTPYGAPPPARPGAYLAPPPYGGPGPYGASAPGAYGAAEPGPPEQPTAGGLLAQRFAGANVTHDGRLTRTQAAAEMPFVVQNFDAIDVQRRGYVTLSEVRNFMTQYRAQSGST